MSIAYSLSRSLIISLALVWAFEGLGQGNLRIQRFSVEDGLSQSAITCMLQDTVGYLWIGTRDGLNRYDGSTFKVFRKTIHDSTSLSSNIIIDMVLDAKKRMWIATSVGLSCYVPLSERFINYSWPSTGSSAVKLTVNDILFVKPDKIYLATDKGILFFDTQKGTYHSPREYQRFNQERIDRITHHPTLGLLLLTPRGLIGNRGLIHPWDVYKIPFTGRLSVASNGDIFFSRDNSLYKYDIRNSVVKLFYKFDDETPIQEIKPYMNGGIWIGRDKLMHLDSLGKVKFELSHSPFDPYSISGNSITNTYATRDGTIWVGTNGYGLNKIDLALTRFEFLGNLPGANFSLSQPYVNCVLSQNDTIVLVGTGQGGLDMMDLHARTKVRRQLPEIGKENFIISMFQDEQDQLWLGTRAGLFEGTFSKGFHQIPFFKDHIIFSISKVRPGSILIASNLGVYVYNHKTGKTVFQKTAASPIINAYPVLWDDHHIWESGNGVLRVMDLKGNIRLEFAADEDDSTTLPVSGIKCIFKDSQHRIWIGSWGGGLSLYQESSHHFRTFRTKEGLPNDVVYGIMEDYKGLLWLSTNKGLSCFDPVTEHFTNYSSADGLQGDEFNTGAYYKSLYGKLYFGGINGLTAFYPRKVLNFADTNPTPQLINFYINELPSIFINEDLSPASIQFNRSITLNADTRSFAFEISSIVFSNPKKIQYRYKLTPFHDDWVNAGSRKYINFTNIPPGEYTFTLAASTMKGNWSPHEMTIHVSILAPLWKKPWFVFLMITLAVLAIYFVSWYRMRLYRKRNLMLEQQVNERTRELQVKNEEIESQNEELQSQSEEMFSQNEQLNELKLQLEQKVDERTRELKMVNIDLLSKNTQLEQFTFIIAHNLNGPMARIKGLINLFNMGYDADEVKKRLSQSVDDLDAVIKDLGKTLDLMYGVKEQLEQVSLRGQLDETLKTLEDDIRKTGAVVKLKVTGDVFVLGIKQYLHSIFYNLLHNALKYARTDEPLKLEIEAIEQNGQVIVTVQDNGIGIDMRYARDKLFKIYQRFHTQIPGRGLGLYLVKTQTEILGGSIEVDSVPSKGTVFKITLAR